MEQTTKTHLKTTEDQEAAKKVTPFVTPNSKKLLTIYEMAQSNNMREQLAYILLASNESYMIADKEAARILQQKETNRSYYTGISGKLMDYSFDETVDRSTDDVIINLLTVAINDYLSDKQDLPTDKLVLNKVKVLFMQLIIKGVTKIIDELNIPPYVAEMVKIAEDRIDEGLDEAFNGWCQDLEDTDNGHLVEWMKKEVGPSIFGTEVSTKPKTKYNQYMSKFIGSIKDPEILYQKFLKRKSDYDNYVTREHYNKIYDIFELTADQFNKVQKKLYDDFQLSYSENVNAQYIKELLHGK